LLAAATLGLPFALAWPHVAPADPQTFPVGASPVLVVQGADAHVTVHTWNRQQIQVDGDGALVRYVPANVVASRVPSKIPIWAESGQSRLGDVSLPPESFLLPPLPGQAHDAVTVRGDGTTVVTIPQNTALVFARVGRGSIAMDGYRGGTFVTILRNGQIRLDGVAGTGFVQVLHGRLTAQNSSFDRLRVRSLTANLVFSNCDARQIQATSVNGNILFDNGSFQPGLARFESQRGNVALGVGSGSASFGAHSTQGRVVDAYGGRGADPSAPVVTATSQTGNVLLYRGSARDNVQVLQQWPQSRGILYRAQTNARPKDPGATNAGGCPGTSSPRRCRRRIRRRSIANRSNARPGPHRVRPRRTRRRGGRRYSKNLRKTAMSSLNACCGSTASTW
jgi:hypothetical protein